MARSAWISRIAARVIATALVGSACGFAGASKDYTMPPPNLRVTGVAPLRDVPLSAYDIICPDEPRGVIGPGLECIDDDEVPSLSHVHFQIVTNGSGGGSLHADVRALDRGLDVVWHSRIFFVDPRGGQRHWIGRVTLDEETTCRERFRDKVLRLRVSAVGFKGPEISTVARLVFEGNCQDGELRLLNGDPFDPALVYHNDLGWSTAEGPPIPRS